MLRTKGSTPSDWRTKICWSSSSIRRSQKNDHSGGVLPIKAPIAGTVVERNVVIGQLVDASTTAFRIVNTSTLWADGQVYEK